ncbi:HCLS1-binding protein 3 [Trichosurus vulpecula]|uniref:HCLS1-binding protein 3 n=1 Tax=Trichosurus vulpecula TaxID=9337 RepID=UPI00186AC9F6|nr:HCLS1-binding protein 3 [Trichosurus vulpecula]
MQPGPSVLVASRQVQNVHTGLDLSVPTYQEFRGKMMSGHIEYQIMVVTWLPAFKSAKHRAEDIVQFMVSRKYSEIEEFYQKLTSRYPQAALPPLPRKILFVGESDIRERRTAFNEIMRQIAKDEELATSPELLAFLGSKFSGGTDLTGRGPLEQAKDEADGDTEDGIDFFQEPDKTVGGVPLPSSLSRSGEEEEEEEEEVLDPLGIMRSKKPKKPPASIQARPKETPLGSGKESRPKMTIFDEEVDGDEELFSPKLVHSAPRGPSRDSLRLFDDPDLGGKVSLGDSLLLPTACERRQVPTRGISDDLFGVEEDLEKILSLESEPISQALPRAKPQVPTKPAIPKKPMIPPPKAGTPPVRAAPREGQQQVQVQALNELDILKYIQDQNSADNTAPSLF